MTILGLKRSTFGKSRPAMNRLRRSEAGFSLLELMWVMVLAAILLSLGAFAVRHYRFRMALEGGADQVVTKVRGAQQAAVTETHPVVYGVRFVPGTSIWGIVSYDPRRTAPKCRAEQNLEFKEGVIIKSAAFTSAGAAGTECGTAFSTSNFAFFFARGSATEGSVVLRSDQVSGERTISVAGVTGRVTSK